MFTNNPDKDLMEKDNDERNVRDKGENQEKKIEIDNEHEDQTAVLAWTAGRLLALPVEVSMLQAERPFLGPPGEKRRRAPRISST